MKMSVKSKSTITMMTTRNKPKTKWGNVIRSPFFLFCISGGLAFWVDFFILWALSQTALSLWLARAIAFLCAATFTWQFNRTITFKSRAERFKNIKGWVTYIGLALIGGLFNYAASMGVLTYFSTPTPLILFIAVAAGSCAGLVANFVTSNFWFFKKPPPH